MKEMEGLKPEAIVTFFQEVPTLNVEAEMAARLESKTGDITQNDVLEMQSFYTAIPYSSRMVAEKAFVSLARQAKLDTQYKTFLSQSLEDLRDVYR